MSRSTRRIVFLSVIVVLLTIPAEILLLRALAVPDQKEAVRDWASSMSAEALRAEAGRIQFYPYLYRREIMTLLEPGQRARVWQQHLDGYIRSRPSLDVNTVALLRSMRAMLTPALFDNPTEAQRESVRVLGDRIAEVLGQEDAEYLMARLGPKDGSFASFEPTAMYLSNKVRGLFVGLAQGFTCDCEITSGCYSGGSVCEMNSGCAIDTSWPACGWYWNDACHGACMAGW